MHGKGSAWRGLSRREILEGGIASFLALLAPEVLVVARARAATDPRTPLVDRLCDLVIPPTDTPGAAEAGAGAFVLLAIDHRVANLDATVLSRVEAALDGAAGGSFLQTAPARQEALLTKLDQKSFTQLLTEGSPEQAWRLLKPAIVAGYYTSEIGASRELVYEPVPDSERSNFKLTPDYRARSNEGFGGEP
jgi:glucoside 3-dehydrogenase (cytochrome c) hitch-hiker subunit